MRIASKITAPKIAVRTPPIVSDPEFTSTPNRLTTHPPINAPMIPTTMFASAPICAFVFMIIEATQPASAPTTIHTMIFTNIIQSPFVYYALVYVYESIDTVMFFTICPRTKNSPL